MKSISEYMRQTGLTIQTFNMDSNTWVLRNPHDQYKDLTIRAYSVPQRGEWKGLPMYAWSDVVAQAEKEAHA